MSGLSALPRPVPGPPGAGSPGGGSPGSPAPGAPPQAVPGRRESVVTATGIFAFSLLFRVWAAAIVSFPRPEDTAYYVGVARNLVTGRGLVSDAIWSYGTPPLEFPRPAFEVWLPLPSFLSSLPMALFGPTFGAAQWSSVIVGAVVAALAWRLAADVAADLDLPPFRARSLAIGAGLTAGVYLPLVLHSALPDSTMPFAALSLAAGLLMARIVRDPAGARPTDRRVLVLGLVLGLAALTRNEAAWLALAWAVAAFGASRGWRDWTRLVGGTAAVAFLVFAPWAARDWLTFGSPFPGQALANALSLDGRDIFAYAEPPTLERYLGAGVGTLVGQRVTALLHNLLDVLVVPGIPISLFGLAGLGSMLRLVAVRPLVIAAVITFGVTTLVFPVATTWGTYLHAAGAVGVLLVIGALLALDRLLEVIGGFRGWNRPVAWLAPTLTVAAGLLISLVLLLGFGADGRRTAAKYAALETVLASAGERLGPDHPPVITDFPIWLAEETGVRALALPDESPASAAALAGRFGATLLIVDADNGGRWPEILDAGDPEAACFHPLTLGTVVDPTAAELLRAVLVYRIECR